MHLTKDELSKRMFSMDWEYFAEALSATRGELLAAEHAIRYRVLDELRDALRETDTPPEDVITGMMDSPWWSMEDSARTEEEYRAACYANKKLNEQLAQVQLERDRLDQRFRDIATYAVLEALENEGIPVKDVNDGILRRFVYVDNLEQERNDLRVTTTNLRMVLQQTRSHIENVSEHSHLAGFPCSLMDDIDDALVVHADNGMDITDDQMKAVEGYSTQRFGEPDTTVKSMDEYRTEHARSDKPEALLCCKCGQLLRHLDVGEIRPEKVWCAACASHAQPYRSSDD